TDLFMPSGRVRERRLPHSTGEAAKGVAVRERRPKGYSGSSHGSSPSFGFARRKDLRTMHKPLLLTLPFALLASTAIAQDQVVNVFNWSDYIAEDTLELFEAETGISVEYNFFDNNEMVENLLLAGSSGYDVVVPSGFFLERQ